MLRFGAKVPGLGLDVRSVTMDFTYGSAFSVDSPDAYETLILDALKGDASLFTRADEVEEAWSIVDPIIDSWASGRPPDIPELCRRHMGPARGRCADRARRPALAPDLTRPAMPTSAPTSDAGTPATAETTPSIVPGEPILRWSARAHSISEIETELTKIWAAQDLTVDDRGREDHATSRRGRA